MHENIISRGDQGSVKFLVESKGVDVNSRDARGRTAGHYAADAGHHGVLEYLLDAGLTINSRSPALNFIGRGCALQWKFFEPSSNHHLKLVC